MSVFIVIGPFARTLTTNEIWQDHSYLSCMDGIALGCITALFVTKYKLSLKVLNWVTGLGYTLFIICILFKRQIFKLGLSDVGLNVTLLEIATAMLIISIHGRILRGEAKQSKLTLPIQWFGRNSYEIYLTHMFVVTALAGTSFMDQNGLSTLPIGFVLVVGLSGIFGQFVAMSFSEPANRWIRARLVPKLNGILNVRVY